MMNNRVILSKITTAEIYRLNYVILTFTGKIVLKPGDNK